MWLNLDWSSDDPYPGRPYFEGQKVVTFTRDAETKASPKIVPVIDDMESSDGWEMVNDGIGSSISIKSTIGKKGNALEISYDLEEGGWVEISKEIDPGVLAGTVGIEFSNYGVVGSPNTIELRLAYEDNTSFGFSWRNATVTNEWSIRKVLYTLTPD